MEALDDLKQNASFCIVVDFISIATNQKVRLVDKILLYFTFFFFFANVAFKM